MIPSASCWCLRVSIRSFNVRLNLIRRLNGSNVAVVPRYSLTMVVPSSTTRLPTIRAMPPMHRQTLADDPTFAGNAFCQIGDGVLESSKELRTAHSLGFRVISRCSHFLVDDPPGWIWECVHWFLFLGPTTGGGVLAQRTALLFAIAVAGRLAAVALPMQGNADPHTEVQGKYHHGGRYRPCRAAMEGTAASHSPVSKLVRNFRERFWPRSHFRSQYLLRIRRPDLVLTGLYRGVQTMIIKSLLRIALP